MSNVISGISAFIYMLACD